MQVHGAAQGVGTTIPRRGRRLLEALLAIVAILLIVAVMALMTRGVLAPTSSGLGAQDANLKASAVKNTGIMHASIVRDMGQMRGTDSGKAAPLNAGAGSAVVHDDAGNVKPR